jgi:hypothetical protein
MGNTLLAHQSPRRLEELSKELLIAGSIGAVKGSVISITTGLMLRLLSPTYRTARTQVKVWYHVTWISMGIVFWADKQLVKFEERVAREERERHSKILDEAADRGIFIEG